MNESKINWKLIISLAVIVFLILFSGPTMYSYYSKTGCLPVFQEARVYSESFTLGKLSYNCVWKPGQILFILGLALISATSYVSSYIRTRRNQLAKRK
ncbi:hypothetical protein HY837_06105 [archaeon]|nr:hypothetical protein [archaeon]